MIDAPDTISGLAAEYRRGELSPVEVIDDHLARITRVGVRLNAFVAVNRERARTAAHQSLERFQRGDPRPLEGIPVTVKDNVAMAGLPTGEGSLTSSQLNALVDAPAVARLREAGAVILAKTTTPEFGWKGTTDSPLTGTTYNPWNLEHTPGGSSGGAAASLAAGIGTTAHGNDGGGSIRIPASYCGLYGLKPTFGRVPQAPINSPYATLVSNGPLTRSVEDAALMLNVMSRPDLRDWHAIPHDPRDWSVGLNDGIKGLRFAYTETLGGASVDAEVSRLCRATLSRMGLAGIDVIELDELIEPLRPQFEKYWMAGFASRLRTISPDRRDELDPGFRALAEQGLDVGVEAIDRAYVARAKLATTLKRVHLDYDLLLTPTMPATAPRVDVLYHGPDFDRWNDAVPFTLPFNLTGQPAASIPVGVSSDGLPVGMQIAASHLREDLVLRASRAILDMLGWRWPEPSLGRRIAMLHAE
ncbi:MAG: amidase [Actinomycetia bacterium]|nr:amidase [Actinomycetes bacterium]